MSKPLTLRDVIIFFAAFFGGGVYFVWIYPFLYHLPERIIR